MKITVIGESNIDITVVPKDKPHQGGCAPGSITFHYGGVARNIAHNLCLLGHDVRLMTVYGGDDYAANLMADCKNNGMDLSLSTQFKDAKSPIFLSFNNEKGEMQSAYSDVALNDKMDLEWLKARMSEVNQSDMVVADTLLNAEALAYLIDHCETPLFVDTVSPGKAMRLNEALCLSEKGSVYAVKCNHAEAVAITGENDYFESAKILNNNGIENVYLSIGSSGVVFSSKGLSKHYPALPSTVVNVTGSGDAFLAGVVHAHTLGHYGEEAVVFGLRAAQHNIKNEAPVNPTLRDAIFNV